MEDSNEYWKLMDYPPVFDNIDWSENLFNIPMEVEQKVPPHVPFQRRRSSSVDLPINPLYLNSNRFTLGNDVIHEEVEETPCKIGSSSTLEFPLNSNFDFNFNFNFPAPNKPVQSKESNVAIPPHSTHQTTHTRHKAPTKPKKPIHDKPKCTQPDDDQNKKKQQQHEFTFFPELHRTSYNNLLGKKLKNHQKRRRSSSLPPVFTNNSNKQPNKIPTPLIFTQIHVTDPTPIQHTQKAAKIDAKPIAIERVLKKKIPETPLNLDPIEHQQRLDQELLDLNMDDVTVAELKEMLKERGLSNTGKKVVLLERLIQARDRLMSASPAIQGMANMTIHSPLYQYQNPLVDELHLNDIIQFDPLDSNGILFPPPETKRPNLTSWDSEWDQDRLDHFLTELV